MRTFIGTSDEELRWQDQRIRELEAQLAQAEQLGFYTAHKGDCSFRPWGVECDCGYDQLIATYRAAHPIGGFTQMAEST